MTKEENLRPELASEHILIFNFRRSRRDRAPLAGAKKTFIKYDGPQQNWNLYGKRWPVISQRHNFLMKHLNAVAKMLNSKSEVKLQNKLPCSLNGPDPTELRRFEIR